MPLINIALNLQGPAQAQTTPIQSSEKPLGSCQQNDSQSTYDVALKNDGIVFIICDAPRKLNLSDSQITAIKQFASDEHNPTVLLLDSGEMDINTPFPEFIVQDYKNKDTVAGWQGIVSAFNFIKDKSNNNSLHRYWSLDSIDKIQKALLGPVPFGINTTTNALEATSDLQACSSLNELKANGDADLQITENGNQWRCIIKLRDPKTIPYKKPRTGTPTEKILTEALKIAGERKLDQTSTILTDSLAQYHALIPLETSNSTLSLSAPKVLVISNYAEATKNNQNLPATSTGTQTGATHFNYANLTDNTLRITMSVKISDDIAKSAGGKAIGLNLSIKNKDGKTVPIDRVNPSFEVPATTQASFNLNQVADPLFLSIGTHQIFADLVTTDGKILSSLNQPLQVAAIKAPDASFESCVNDNNSNFCIIRINPDLVSANPTNTGLTNFVSTPVSSNYSGNSSVKLYDLDYSGSSFVYPTTADTSYGPVYSLPSGAVSLGTTVKSGAYCRANEGASDCNQSCTSSTGCGKFIVYNLSSLITDSTVRANLAKYHASFVLPNDRIRLPVHLNPTDIDNLYDTNGKRIEDLAKVWEGVRLAYQHIVSLASSEKNDVNKGAANRAVEEINRRLDSGSVSYVNGEKITVYNLSKLVPSLIERNSIGTNNYPGTSYDANSDTFVILPKFSYANYLGDITSTPPQNKINGLNKKDWENIRTIFRAIASSANHRPIEEKFSLDNAAQSAAEIDKRLSAYKPSSQVYERVDDNFIVFNISQYGFTQEDVDKVKGLDHFKGTSLQNAFQSNNMKLPASIKVSDVYNEESGLSPYVVSISRKLYAVYEAIQKEASGKNAAADNQDSLQSLDTIRRYIIEAYTSTGGCDSTNENAAYLANGTNFVICNVEKKLQSTTINAVKQIIQGDSVINIDENGEMTLPQSINLTNITVNFDKQESIDGWKNVGSIYQYIIDNASNDLTHFNQAKESKSRIEQSLIGPPPFTISNNQDRIIVSDKLSSCSSMKPGEDPDVTAGITVSDSKVNSCTLLRTDDTGKPVKYKNPQDGSKFQAILQETLKEAEKSPWNEARVSSDDSQETSGWTYADFVTNMLENYQSQIATMTENGGLSITAPTLLKKTIAATQAEQQFPASGGKEDYEQGLEQYNTVKEIFEGFDSNIVPIQYKFDTATISDLMSSYGAKSVMLRAKIVSGNIESNSWGNAEVRQNTGEINWKVDPNIFLDHLTTGSHTFKLELYTGTTVLASVEQKFDITSPQVATGSYSQQSGNQCQFPATGKNAAGEDKPNPILSILSAKSPLKQGDTVRMYFKFYPPTDNWQITNDNETYTYTISIDGNVKDEKDLREDSHFKTPDSKPAESAFDWDTAASGTKVGSHEIKLQLEKVLQGSSGSRQILCDSVTVATIDVVKNLGNTQPSIVDGQSGNKTSKQPSGQTATTPTPTDLKPWKAYALKLFAIIKKYYVILISGLAVLGIVIGGLMFITAGGDTKAAEKAKKTIGYIVIGIFVAVLSLVIINIAVNEINAFLSKN